MQDKQIDQSHTCMPLRYSICVSGAAAGETVAGAAHLAERLGAAIAESGHTLTTGATVGLPYHAARGAKSKSGKSIGFSPASSLREHLHKYRLPHCYFDFINFTGMNYVGRDQYLIQSSDAVITVGGRFGSLHEFTTALEAGKPCGILVGTGGTADIIPQLMEAIEPPHKNLVIYDDNPENLVKRIIQILDIENQGLNKDMIRDEHWIFDKPISRAG
jgi:uncharacterized protein (TIGR00725 family)